jgi:hypothetical protein
MDHASRIITNHEEVIEKLARHRPAHRRLRMRHLIRYNSLGTNFPQQCQTPNSVMTHQRLDTNIDDVDHILVRAASANVCRISVFPSSPNGSTAEA